MKPTLAVLALLTACGVDDLTSDQQAIISGTPTSAQPEVMQFVGAPDAQGHIVTCTATLISPTTFLTASHCIDWAPMAKGGFVTTVNNELLHIDRVFSQGGGARIDDLAVGRLLQSPTATTTPATISTREPANPDELTVIGYGCLSSKSENCSPSARAYTSYEVGGDTYNYAPGDSGGPTYIGSIEHVGAIPIVRVTSGGVIYTGADIGADPVAYRTQLDALSTALQASGVSYRSQVQSMGWTAAVSNDGVSGTMGQSLRLEGLQVWTQNPNLSVCYTAYVQDVGWQNHEACDGELAGTVGQAKRMEAVKIRMKVGANSVRYRTFVQDLGWQPWVMNNTMSGTTGQSRRIEAIQIDFTPTIIIPPGCCTGIN